MRVIVSSITMVLVLLLGVAGVQAQSLSFAATGNTDAGDPFEGTYDLEEFATDGDGALQALGRMSGSVVDNTGEVIITVTGMPVTIPVTSASGSCEILSLELGPFDLDLLGLVVHLDMIALDISAGSDRKLGNLLCRVARILESNRSDRHLARLLNQILALL